MLDHVVYDSFGNILTETNASNGDRFKFAGMEYDSTTKQYFDRGRWYGAGLGRFAILDPMGFRAADTNLFRYVTNEPTNGSDRNGFGDVLVTTGPPSNGLTESFTVQPPDQMYPYVEYTSPTQQKPGISSL